jgi:hypothetical protein
MWIRLAIRFATIADQRRLGVELNQSAHRHVDRASFRR